MSETTPIPREEVNAVDEYREQIRRCARALSLARNEQIRSDIAEGFTLEQVKMFTDGNLDKRYEKLLDQTELLGEAFENLEDWVAEYVQTVPLAAYDTGTSDGDRFLQWLRDTKSPTPQQADYITCQHSRHAAEALARDNRMAHIRFQDLSGMTNRLLEELGRNPDLQIHLNPVHVWATFRTKALLDEEIKPPANVVFFARGDQIHTAVLEPSGQALVYQLEAIGPCTLDEWLIKNDTLEREYLIEFCRDSAEMGLTAFG